MMSNNIPDLLVKSIIKEGGSLHYFKEHGRDGYSSKNKPRRTKPNCVYHTKLIHLVHNYSRGGDKDDVKYSKNINSGIYERMDS